MYFNKKYFLIFLSLLAVEILIALFVKDRIIRPFVGDFLVVILMYTFVKSWWNTRPVVAGIAVLLFSYFVETLQYFQVVDLLGLRDNKFWSTIIGITFDWRDILAYTLGILCVLLVEKLTKK